ncbi:hypothetical protein [Pontibacter vulgaris]|uniref:hypothetical protein n=1 Tax=Pontibacter vulgaris TaxID=2905679 RepID=UPI001FA6FA7E|nr:hypothetical protein [Pontibacter vulgaris]
MTIKKLHYISGLIITGFIGIHLTNHFYSIVSVEEHIRVMDNLRHLYRNLYFEAILLGAILFQVISGLKLFLFKRKTAILFFERLQVWSGLYLAIFFIIHLSAVLVGRHFLQLDTNFYFGVAGLNTFPLNLVFIPYYGLAIMSFFGHIAGIHNTKMKRNVLGITPFGQSIIISMIGVCLTVFVFYGLTNRFRGVTIPSEYNVLIGK